MKLEIITTGTEPITIAQAKEYLQVDYDHDDSLIGRLIIAARQHVENLCGSSVVEKLIDLSVDGYSTPYLLPYGPVKEIHLIEVDDIDLTVLHMKADYIHIPGKKFRASYTVGYIEPPAGLVQIIYDILKIYYDARGTAVQIPPLTMQGLRLYTRNLL